MTLPRVRAALATKKEKARVLRAALRHQEHVVKLAAPAGAGQLGLEIEVEGEELVVVLAERVGDPSANGQRLALRPVTRAQMAEILALLERIDDPAESVPPSAGDDEAEGGLDDGPTIMDSVVVSPLASRATNAAPAGPKPGEEEEEEDDDDAPTNILAPDAPVSDGVVIQTGTAPSLTPGARGTVAETELPPAGQPGKGQAPSMVARIIANKYLVEDLLGSGASAAVYRAIHADLRRPVAVKILHSQVRGQEQFVKRFKAEALAASRLEHINVTRVLDFGQEPDGLLYLVMELLVGESLEAALSKGRMPASRVIDVMVQVCNALAFAHDEGVIHRDVKPENIMLVPHRDDEGDACDLVKVCDFGLAKLLDPGEDQSVITVTGMLCGSPAYMSPEQARGEKADHRTDIYSLGVSLFEALTGELPHDGSSLQELFSNKMLKPPKRPSQIVPDLDPLLEDIVLRAISADPASRHPNARVLREELKEARAHLDEEDEERDGTLVAG